MSLPVTLDGELMFPSNYIGAVDLKGKDVTLTIESVKIDELMKKGGKKEKKPVLYFVGTAKMLVLNKTNAASLIALYGTEASKWVGNRVTFFPTTDKFGKDTVPAVRIRPVVAAPKAAKSAPAAPAAEPDTNQQNELEPQEV